MADYFAGAISVGGKLKRALLPELVDVLASLSLNNEDNNSIDTTEEYQALLETAATEKRTAHFMDDQAAYGAFPALEDFCVEHQLSFRRHSDAKYEHDAEEVIFFPPLHTEPRIIDSTQSGDLLVPLRMLRDALTANPLATVADFLNNYADTTQDCPPLEIVE